ncbi:MAG TPA: DUF5658 family protein [Steroidobacteraceae bacterium]|jgi:hypothetical protein|nr:DUF5658 family protein [Steroidobacteraceae bacterium]
MARQSQESAAARAIAERRAAAERRTRTLHALLHGSLKPRRRQSRREQDMSFAAVDWHQSRWFAVALLIVILSCADAFFTLRLLADGAYEANPFMAALLNGPPHGFAFAKVGLTSIGVILLTVVARTRAFRLIPVGVVLYAVLLGYMTLVAYEYWLCDHHLLGP